jgi:predicted Zn-dependent protease
VDSKKREAVAQQILARSTADQTEVIVGATDRALTRFTHEASNQNIASSDVAISVRAIVDGRTGVARANRTDSDALDDVVKRALELAQFAPPDPELGTLGAGGATRTPDGAFDHATAHTDADTRARAADAIFAAAEESGCWSAGYVATSNAGYTIGNTSGTLASFDGTNAAINVKMNAADSTGYAEGYANAFATLDAGAIGRLAAEKARASAAPRSVEPGEWTVILEPAAFGELLAYLLAHFSAQSYEEGSSFLSDALGKQSFSAGLTILDDYAHPLAPGMPFDYEGQPSQRVTLVDRGVAQSFVTDSYYAKKLGVANTGNALPAPNGYGPQPQHVVVARGERSLDELIASTERGLLISRFWYIRTVDRKRAIVTGMTRDGTFLIEGGKIAGGVRNLRFNQSIIDALAHCELATEQRRTGGYNYAMVTPAAKIEGFSFTSTTEF